MITEVKDVAKDTASYVADEKLGLELDALKARLEIKLGINTLEDESLFSVEGIREIDSNGERITVAPTIRKYDGRDYYLIRATSRDKDGQVLEDVNMQVTRYASGFSSGHLDVKNANGEFHGREALIEVQSIF